MFVLWNGNYSLLMDGWKLLFLLGYQVDVFMRNLFFPSFYGFSPYNLVTLKQHTKTGEILNSFSCKNWEFLIHSRSCHRLQKISHD